MLNRRALVTGLAVGAVMAPTLAKAALSPSNDMEGHVAYSSVFRYFNGELYEHPEYVKRYITAQLFDHLFDEREKVFGKIVHHFRDDDLVAIGITGGTLSAYVRRSSSKFVAYEWDDTVMHARSMELEGQLLVDGFNRSA